MEADILPPTSDFVFKMIFGDERNASMLIDFLKSLLDLPDEEYQLTFLNPYVKPEFDGDKLGILDVKVRTVTGKIINIEIQVNPVDHIGERISFYKSKLITEQIGEGESYSVIQRVICICITDYPMFPSVSEYWNPMRFCNPVNGLVFEGIPEEIHTLELAKVPERSDGSAGWAWLQFLRSRQREEFEMVAVKNPEIRKAVNTLYQLSASERIRNEYEARKKAERDYINGMEGAYERGRLEEKMNTAQNLRAMGLSTEQIVQATGLSLEKIRNL